MTPALRVFKNSSALTLSILLERGITFFLPWYVARIAGREVWGDYSTAYTFVLIAATLAPWGLVGLLPRKIARDHSEAGRIWINASMIVLCVSLVTTIVMLLATYLLNYPSNVQNLIYLGLLLVLLPSTEATLFETMIQGLERMEWIVFVRLPATFFRVAASIYLLAQGYPIAILFVLLSIYYTINCLLYFTIFKRRIPELHLRPNLNSIQELFVQAFPFFIIVSTTESFKQVDRIFLSKYWGTDAVGIYATGSMFIQLLYMLAPALMGALFPGLSRAYISSQVRFSYLVSWLFKLLTVAIFPVMLFTISFASQMTLLVFGQEYLSSIIVLQLMALGILPSFLSRFLYRVTVASNNERLAIYVAVVGNMANLLLNVVLIPRYGIIGASIATVGTILVNLGQNFWYVTRFTTLDIRRAVLLPGFCVAISGSVYAVLLFYNSIVAFMVATVVFVLVLIVTRTVSQEDLVSLQFVKPR